MLESNIPKLDAPALELIANRTFLLFNHWLLLEHEVKILNIDLRLIDLTEECPHVEKRACQLHKERLYHHKVTRCEPPSGHVPGCQAQIYGESSVEDHCLPNIEL